MPENTLIIDNYHDASATVGITLGIVVIIIISVLIWYYFDNIKRFFIDLYNNMTDNGNIDYSNDVNTISQMKKEVFNIDQNVFTYDESKVACEALGAKLATKKQMEEAQKDGANWCNNGWVEDQLAMWPIQDGYLKSIKGTKLEGKCGKSGLNGGYQPDKNLKLSANCYGYRPRPNENYIYYLEKIMKNTKNEPELIDKYRKMFASKDLFVSPHSDIKWSEFSKYISDYKLGDYYPRDDIESSKYTSLNNNTTENNNNASISETVEASSTSFVAESPVAATLTTTSPSAASAASAVSSASSATTSSAAATLTTTSSSAASAASAVSSAASSSTSSYGYYNGSDYNINGTSNSKLNGNSGIFSSENTSGKDIAYYCDNSSALNYGSTGSCEYAPNDNKQLNYETICDNSSALDYGSSGSCIYNFVMYDDTIKTAVDEWLKDFISAEIKYGHISTWDVSKVTNMEGMFEGASTFNQDISGWDVSNVTNMVVMFAGASTFNQDISGWNVSHVTDMSYMFYNAEDFNQDIISRWTVSKDTNMEGMFSNHIRI